jgi:carboxynorspermidine decarboxylase
MQYALDKLTTPCYLIDLGLLKKNLEILKDVQIRTGCKILLAQKGYAAWSTYDLCGQYLAGTAASSLHEAKLGAEFFKGEIHLCAPAYRDDDMDEYIQLVDHIVFNSFAQWNRFKTKIQNAPRKIACGLRINPMHSEVKTKIYDPCAPGSRLGITLDQFKADALDGITGLHFHTLCELNADSLARTLYKRYPNLKTIYLEPGEAIALNTGILIASVLDVVHNEVDIAILDASCSAHMPDVLEMPYRPDITGTGRPSEKPHTYRLAGPTCLAGDVIGDYSFDKPLVVGNKLIFGDMAHYTMVKNTMFNGVNAPDILLYDPDTDAYKLQRHFTYDDFKSRLS